MQLFLSWSGQRSNALALALRDLVPDVLQNVDVWMSEHDLQAGSRWSTELSARLSECHLGVACVTPENQHSPWLMFEAGAISKSVENGRLIPLLFDIGREQITHPLAQFQLLECNKEGIAKLVSTINSLLAAPLDATRLHRQVERWWPDFAKRLETIGAPPDSVPKAPERSDKEILYEILEKVRAFSVPALAATPSPQGNSKVAVDTRPFLGSNGGTLVVIDKANEIPATTFLDYLWERLVEHEDVPPYTYGSVWVLFNLRTGAPLTEIAAEYIRTAGRKRDNRRIDHFGIRPGDALEIRRVTQAEI